MVGNTPTVVSHLAFQLPAGPLSLATRAELLRWVGGWTNPCPVGLGILFVCPLQRGCSLAL